MTQTCIDTRGIKMFYFDEREMFVSIKHVGFFSSAVILIDVEGTY